MASHSGQCSRNMKESIPIPSRSSSELSSSVFGLHGLGERLFVLLLRVKPARVVNECRDAPARAGTSEQEHRRDRGYEASPRRGHPSGSVSFIPCCSCLVRFDVCLTVHASSITWVERFDSTKGLDLHPHRVAAMRLIINTCTMMNTSTRPRPLYMYVCRVCM